MRVRILLPIGAAVLAGLAVAILISSSLEDGLPSRRADQKTPEPVIAADSKVASVSPSPNAATAESVGDVVQTPAESSKVNSQIDWQKVQRGYPIPHQLPAGLSETPAGAGFMREWVERAVGETPGLSRQYRELPLVNPVPLILEVISEPKDAEDSWPYGLEFELQRMLALEFSGPRAVALTRLFCNGHGCVVYLEHEAGQHPSLTLFTRRIGKSPLVREFGLRSENMFQIFSAVTDLDVRWRMLLIYRHPINP